MEIFNLILQVANNAWLAKAMIAVCLDFLNESMRFYFQAEATSELLFKNYRLWIDNLVWLLRLHKYVMFDWLRLILIRFRILNRLLLFLVYNLLIILTQNDGKRLFILIIYLIWLFIKQIILILMININLL